MAKSIIVYSTKTCGFCMQLKQYLNDHKIKYKDIDVGADRKAAHEMIEKSGQMGVPVTDIDSNIIVGFDRRKIAKALGIE